MNNDIYNSPASNVGALNTKPTSAFKIIAISTVIDIGGSIAFGIASGILYVIYLSAQGHSEKDILARVENIETLSLIGLITGAIGLLISFYAGYYCASKSSANAYRNTAILCIISCTVGFLTSMSKHGIIENIALTSLTAMAIFAGAYLKTKNQ